MSFIFPRQITITRPVDQPMGGGQAPYSGLSPVDETVVIGAPGVSASIQLAGQPGNPTGLPSGVNLNDYRIYNRTIPRGTVKIRDVVTDDLGVRYKVIAPYWDSLGVNLYCRRTDTV